MPSSPPPYSIDRIRAKSERIKLWSGIIAMVLGNIVALTTAILAHFKEETGAKNVYRELSGAIEKVSDDQVQLHKDVAAIRGYLAGQAERSQEPVVLWSPKQDKKPVSVSKGTALRPPIRVGIGIPKPSETSVGEESITVMPPPQAPPPTINPEPKDYSAPPVDAVVKRK